MGTLTKPFTYSSGGFAVASQVNSDFDTVYNWINGGSAMWSDGSVAFTAVPVVPGDPITGSQVARKFYVDTVGNAKVSGQVNSVIMQGGITVVNTDVNGNFTFNYPNAFPNTLITVMMLLGSNNQGFTDYQVLQANSSGRITAAGRVAHTSAVAPGNGYTSGTFTINWIALGT